MEERASHAARGPSRAARRLPADGGFQRRAAADFKVMAGAITVHFLAYRVARARTAPFWAETFALPTRRDFDAKLLVGAALFGVGWGLGGYCPGPSLVSLGAGGLDALVFVSAMMLGLLATGKLATNASETATRNLTPRAEANRQG